MARWSDLQLSIFAAFGKHDYYVLSASEAGNPEIQKLFDDGYAESYPAVGAATMWHLTRKGREEAVRLGLRMHADQIVLDAITGTIERRP